MEGVLYESFSDAAKQMGLLENFTEAEICMEEAKTAMCSPRQLRFLFILLITEGAAALTIFNIHKEYMQADFELNNKLPSHLAENEMLKDLSLRLESYSKHLSDYNLPLPHDDSTEVDKERLPHNVQRNRNLSTKAITHLNLEQITVFNDLRNHIDNEIPGAFYLNGGPGRGRSFLLSTIASYTRGQGKIALCCASSGFVATMYPGGRTAHNLFRIPVMEDEFDLNKIQCDIPDRSQRATLLREASLIIFDEITMTHKNNLQAIDDVLKKVRKEPTVPFGGIIFLCAGDFRQILPIINNGTRADTVDATIKKSTLWNDFTLHNLVTPVRQQNDVEFSQFIDSIADGTYPHTPEGKVTLN